MPHNPKEMAEERKMPDADYEAMRLCDDLANIPSQTWLAERLRDFQARTIESCAAAIDHDKWESTGRCYENCPACKLERLVQEIRNAK
jgi:hypothetical protein